MIKLIGQLTIKLSWIIIDKSDIPLKRKSFMKSTFQRVMTTALCLMLCLSALPLSAAAEGDVEINEANFPDEVFRQYVEMFDNNGDGYLSEEERGWYCYPGEGGTYVGAYEIALDTKNITSLKGIEYFTELLYLYCSWCELTSLDLSQNTLLKELFCGHNQLTSLNLINNTELEWLNCIFNKLTALDVSKSTELRRLFCSNNQLSAINISKNEKLEIIDCRFNKLTALDITNNSELEMLFCYGNPIVKLDISNNPQLIQAVESGIKDYDYDYDINNNKIETVRYFTASGDYHFEIEIPRTTRLQIGSLEPPAVTTQPKDVSAAVGKTVTLSITATGSGLKYQWYKNYEPISGATSSILTVIVKEDMYEPVYFCEISNDGGVVCSKSAKIREIKIPEIHSQSNNVTVAAGKKAEFTVDAWGEDLSYQWYCRKNGSSTWEAMSGKTKAMLSFTAEAGQNGNEYRCEVSNSAGKATSKAIKLTVLTKPKIITQPKTAKVKVGKKVTFKVKATGENLKYQWYRLKPGTKKWEKISKATKASYSFKATRKWNGYKYRCLVKNEAGKVYSKTVKLTVKK